ncbi:hemolysin family protein [Criibacterium bergeronii]|uniref:HlyC/CorC family transporter n=1 Tax=Criibacterium bergeronii TaxID=1871336 RepID=A0A371IIX8_9FIRM|nr:hemolysin family protein [Criibacterium bergeronii]MBS6062913.1 HlyC/CorC family transporter [Peptostreptococcaceae bacterium]RDY20435.1 HlyC/CorC family transporter [Criibacterium bergeronii]
MSDVTSFILLIVLVSCSAFFSSSETALINFNKIRLAQLIKENNKRAVILQNLYEESDKLLSAILVGNNLVNTMISAISTTLATKYFQSSGVGIAVGVATVLILIFGEITPKNFAINNSENISLAVAPFMKVYVTVLTPVIFFFNTVGNLMIKFLGGTVNEKKPLITKEELSTLVDVSKEEGILKVDETTMIKNIFSFKDLTVQDAMKQRMEIVAVSDEATLDEIFSVFRDNKLSRIPVYRDTIDDIIGVLYVKDVFYNMDIEKHQITNENFDITKVMREPTFINEFVNISEFFKKMQANNIHIAIVLDEYGGVSGLITLEDVIESIVGDIFDEYDKDEQSEIVKVKDNVYIINAGIKLTDLQEETGIVLPSEDYESLGGYILENLGEIPTNGQVFEKGRYTFTVISMDKNRIVNVKLVINQDRHLQEDGE